MTIYGSGFQSGTTVSAAGFNAVVNLVDANTLQMTVPSIAAGPIQLVVTNPSGESYTLDNAFTAQ